MKKLLHVTTIFLINIIKHASKKIYKNIPMDEGH